MTKSFHVGVIKGLVLSLALALGSMTCAFADTGVSNDGQNNKMNKLENQIANLQDLIQRQNNEIQKIKSQVASPSERVSTPAAEAPKMDKDDFLLLSKEAYPWLYNLKQGGDLRLRYEAFNNSAFNAFQSDGLTNPNRDQRNRFRIRLRYGFEKKLSEEWTVGFRLATSGDTTTTVGTPDPTSTNTTMGGFFRDKGFWVDQAYAIYKPSLLQGFGPIETAEIGGGKFKNPFEKYSTKMVWDRDVNPEGLYEAMTLGLWKSETNTLKMDIAGGQFILTEGAGAMADSEIFGVQTGLDFATYAFGASPVESRTGFSFYGYPGYENTAAAYDLARGNQSIYYAPNGSGLTYRSQDLNVFEIYQEFKFYPFNKPMKIYGEYAVNATQDHVSGISNDGGLDGRDGNAFTLGGQLGEAKKQGQWEGYLNYFYIGANSVAGAFADSDYGWYGHANNKGWNFGVGYALTDFLTLSWNNWVCNPVETHTDPLASSQRAGFTDYRSQVDLVWKF